MHDKLLLIGARGGGSAIVEALFVLADIDFDVQYVEWEQLRDPQGPLAAHNPLCEVPTLRLLDGRVLTESAAIALWVGDSHPHTGLVPALGTIERSEFQRWLIWLVAAVYATFTYGDHPERYVDGEAAGQQLRARSDARRHALWQQLESAAHEGPYFLGEKLTALDLYIAVMTQWRPRREWFARHCPRLSAIALRVDAIETLQPVWRCNRFGSWSATP